MKTLLVTLVFLLFNYISFAQREKGEIIFEPYFEVTSPDTIFETDTVYIEADPIEAKETNFYVENYYIDRIDMRQRLYFGISFYRPQRYVDIWFYDPFYWDPWCWRNPFCYNRWYHSYYHWRWNSRFYGLCVCHGYVTFPWYHRPGFHTASLGWGSYRLNRSSNGFLPTSESKFSPRSSFGGSIAKRQVTNVRTMTGRRVSQPSNTEAHQRATETIRVENRKQQAHPETPIKTETRTQETRPIRPETPVGRTYRAPETVRTPDSYVPPRRTVQPIEKATPTQTPRKEQPTHSYTPRNEPRQISPTQSKTTPTTSRQQTAPTPKRPTSAPMRTSPSPTPQRPASTPNRSAPSSPGSSGRSSGERK